MHTSTAINDFHTNIENAFYSFVGGQKKFHFSVFLLFLCDESFCWMRTRMRALNKITIAVSRNIILMELTRVCYIRWLRIMNIKCNKFIILRECVKMPFLWLRVCHCRSFLLLFLSSPHHFMVDSGNNVHETILPDGGKNAFNNVYLAKPTLCPRRASIAVDLCNLFPIFTFHLAGTFKMWLLWSVAIQMYGESVICFHFYEFYFRLVSMRFRHRTEHILYVYRSSLFSLARSHHTHITYIIVDTLSLQINLLPLS